MAAMLARVLVYTPNSGFGRHDIGIGAVGNIREEVSYPHSRTKELVIVQHRFTITTEHHQIQVTFGGQGTPMIQGTSE